MLWVATEASALIGFVPIFLQWARADERAAKRIDARQDAPGDSRVAVPARSTTTLIDSDDETWKAYWMTRTGTVPSAREWVPNSPRE
jgi:hypothetical protein